MSIKFVLDLNRTFRLTKEGVAPVSEHIEELVMSLSKKYNLSRSVTVLKSKYVNVPLVIGWLKPVVLLPIAITIGLESKHLELIIAHELAHIKRMDFAVNILQSVVQICLFYHPTVYWINKVIRDEREYICDHLALEVLGNDENAKINLAKALLGTEELREGNLSLLAVAASGGMLKHRISHILDSQYKPATSLRSVLFGIFVFLFSFGAFSTSLNLSQEKQIDEQPFQMETLAQPISQPVRIETNQTRRKGLLANNERISTSSEEKKSVNKSNVQVGDKKPLDKSKITLSNNIEKTTSSYSKEQSLKTKVVSKSSNDQIAIARIPVSSTLELNKPKTVNKAKGNNSLFASMKKVKNEQASSKVEFAKQTQLKPKPLNMALSAESSGKDLSEQYSLPSSLPSQKTKPLKVASLDLNSTNAFTEPKAIFTPYPKYPRLAWSSMIDQTIRVNFKIDTEGKVSIINIVQKADREFTREIQRKLRHWRYQPATKNGQKVAHTTSLEFMFKAPQKQRIRLITTGSRIPKL